MNTTTLDLIVALTRDLIRCEIDEWTISQEIAFSYRAHCGHDPQGYEMRWVQDLIGLEIRSHAIPINSDRDPSQDNFVTC